MKEYLWNYNIKFETQEFKNQRGLVERAIFKVPCDVVVNIIIKGDFEKSQIKINTKNMERLSEYNYIYEIDEINEALLEEFYKFLISKPNNFRRLGKHQSTVARPASSKPSILDTQYPEVEEEHGNKKKGLLDSIKSLFPERR